MTKNEFPREFFDVDGNKVHVGDKLLILDRHSVFVDCVGTVVEIVPEADYIAIAINVNGVQELIKDGYVFPQRYKKVE